MSEVKESKFLARMPKGFRVGHSGDLACSHRDVSTCDECVARYANIVDGSGCHYWMKDAAEVQDWNDFTVAVTNHDDLSKWGY